MLFSGIPELSQTVSLNLMLVLAQPQAKHALGERDVNTREEGSAKVEKASALGGQVRCPIPSRFWSYLA